MDLFEIADTLSSLSTAQCAELVEMLETRWNVRVPQPTGIVPPVPEPVEPTAFEPTLPDPGSRYLRKSFDTLAERVRADLDQYPLSGDLFLFVN